MISKKIFFVWVISLIGVMTAMAADHRFTLVIDAGHGGKDSGAPGAVTQEKTINLKVALAFGKYVERNCPDVRVIYTRTTDVYLTLQERANIANRNKADLFISIHTNALDKGKISRGFETYTLGMHRAADNLNVAKRENSVILIEKNYKQRYAGFDPNSSESYIMFELMQDKNMANSVELAKLIQSETCSFAGRVNKGVHQAGFLVLRETSMPSCLVELGFITTPDEEQFLNSTEGQDKLGHGIYNAFVKYKKRYGNTKNLGQNAEKDEPDTHLMAEELTTPAPVASVARSEKPASASKVERPASASRVERPVSASKVETPAKPTKNENVASVSKHDKKESASLPVTPATNQPVQAMEPFVMEDTSILASQTEFAQAIPVRKQEPSSTPPTPVQSTPPPPVQSTPPPPVQSTPPPAVQPTTPSAPVAQTPAPAATLPTNKVNQSPSTPSSPSVSSGQSVALSQTQPSTSTPKPQPQPTPSQPQPSKPQTQPSKPQPQPTPSKPQPSQPQTQPSQPQTQPTPSKPQPSQPQPQPQPTPAKPQQPSKIQSQPAPSQPQPSPSQMEKKDAAPVAVPSPVAEVEPVPQDALPGGRPIFKVQIAASSVQLASDAPQFMGLKGVEMYAENGMFKYTVGASPDLDEINRLRKTVSVHFPQAFVIAFRDGYKMNISEALREYKKNKATVQH